MREPTQHQRLIHGEISAEQYVDDLKRRVNERLGKVRWREGQDERVLSEALDAFEALHTAAADVLSWLDNIGLWRIDDREWKATVVNLRRAVDEADQAMIKR